ncbi:MAG: hypothetical protein HYZ75_11460 [Elusimicrobia bacterium]|nr:hypothetical protein [Elusimicrobiota bacterium]
MRQAAWGLVFVLAAGAAGFFWGRSRRAEARRLAAEAASAPAPTPAAPVAAPPTLPPPPDLPGDTRRVDSIPQGLE